MSTSAAARAASSRGLLHRDRDFVVAAGVECSAPVIAGGIRMDELRSTGHWDRVESDLAQIAASGIRTLRYGVPFHVVAADPERLDWAWTDRAFGALQANGIDPIADLLHFGVPDDLDGFIDPRLPDRFAAYVEAFVARYPWVQRFTPVNEPLVTAVFSARNGWWNERRSDDRSFAAAIDIISTCVVRAMAIIRSHRPDAIFLQSDGCESYVPATRAALPLARFRNALRFVTFDLSYGRRPPRVVVDWLAANGVGEDRLAWFAEHGSDEGCVVGHDYYVGNEWLIHADGSMRQVTERRGYAELAREYHAHLGLPFMLSETNYEGPDAQEWLAETWNASLNLRLEGLPIRGFVWYGFIDHVDWDTCLREPNGRQNPCGLVGLDRRPHPVGLTYQRLAEEALVPVFHPLPIHAARPLSVHHSDKVPAPALDASGPTVVSGEAIA